MSERVGGPGRAPRGALPGLVATASPFAATEDARLPLLSWRLADWDALTPADLQACVATDEARRLMQRVREVGASRHALLPAVPPPAGPRRLVLVVDEPGLTGEELAAMLAHAHEAYPAAEPVLLPVWVSAARMPRRMASPDGPALRRLPAGHHLHGWLAQAQALYARQADAGFEALLLGVPVHLWGRPFYGGWGLNEEHGPLSGAPRGRATLEALFEATVMRRSAYADLARRGSGSPDDLLDSLILQREAQARLADLGSIEARGMPAWKRPFVRPFLQAGGQPMRWQPRLAAPVAPGTGCMAVWGATPGPVSDPTSTPRPSPPPSRLPRLHIEDGFLRSVGLGSDLIPPSSLVLDRQGLYVDADGPSDLLDLLNQAPWPAAWRERAARLRAEIVRLGVSKYNFVRCVPQWSAPPGRLKVLVAGQVADDAGVRLALGHEPDAVDGAEALLRQVRACRPEAFIVYKPHPDVLSGNRRGLVQARRWCDVVDAQADVVSLIEAVDEVHVLSSLAGFDALLRDKPVYTYGRPFYAGWGLTHDRCGDLRRRGRKLTLDDLVAATLLVYPLYWDWTWCVLTSAEATIRDLSSRIDQQFLPSPRQLPGRLLNKTKRWVRNLLRD